MHNRWKLGLNQLLQEILPLVKLIRFPTTVCDEQRGLVQKLKNTKVCPGDVSFRIDHYLDETYWRTPLQRILIDVTTSNSIEFHTPLSEEARLKENFLQLREKERGKFERTGKTNKKTAVTLTGEDIMRDFNTRKYAFLPAVVSPYGTLGNIIDRFLFGTNAVPPPSLNKKHAMRAWTIATSTQTPQGILERASKLWREDHPGEHYGPNYRTMDPTTSASQRLGQLVCVANGTHILHAIEKMNGEPVPVEDDNSYHNIGDWINDDIENDAATCPETQGYESLLNMSESRTDNRETEEGDETARFSSESLAKPRETQHQR